jgi:hypothetical protein
MKASKIVIARNEAISELCQSQNGYIVLSNLPLLLTFVLSLFLSTNVFAQGADTLSRDTSVKFVIRDPATINNNKLLLVIDNKKFYTESYDKLFPEPAEILNINVLKGKNAIEKYGKKGNKGVIVIMTKTYAVQLYQKKFSPFSKKYQDYLKDHQNNDESISYVLNGVFLSVKPADRTKELYEIPANKIKAVEFTENQYYNGGDSRPYIVIIGIKK